MLRVGACLSLTGPYARFGRQAAWGLEAWRRLTGRADLAVEDDRGDPAVVAAAIRALAGRCDLLLGPYSTGLTRAAVRALEGVDALLWNHGGAGDSVQAAPAGRVVSVLTPAGRYAEPLVALLAGRAERGPLVVAGGRGGFGRRVAAGAEAAARRLGLTVHHRPAPEPPDLSDLSGPAGAAGAPWDLLCAGSFEEDVEAVARARALPHPPRTLCAVAAGVREFDAAASGAGDVLGIAQWLPGAAAAAEVGPAETDFLAAYAAVCAPADATPDYPAVQAAAAAALGAHCADLAGSAEPAALWRAAVSLRTTTLFGPFGIDPATGAQTRHGTVLARHLVSDGGVALVAYRSGLTRPPPATPPRSARRARRPGT